MTQLVELTAKGASVRLLPHRGGRISALRLCTADDEPVEVLHRYPENVERRLPWPKGGIFPLIPYSNRIADATLHVQGRTFKLQSDPNLDPQALHGNAQAQAWSISHCSQSSAAMCLDSPASDAWPWHYTAGMQLKLSAHELSVTLSLVNTDAKDMPAGLGLHPYILHQGHESLSFHAKSSWPTDANLLATVERSIHADENYAVPRSLPSGSRTLHLSQWSGVTMVGLGAGKCLRVMADCVFTHLVLHRPDAAGYICLEPVTHVVNAFNLANEGVRNTGARVLAPGETLSGTVRFQLV